MKDKIFSFPIETFENAEQMFAKMKNAEENTMFLIKENRIKNHEGDDSVELTWAKIIKTRD
jgi:uncharacterized protein YaiL (DUF2058 family)